MSRRLIAAALLSFALPLSLALPAQTVAAPVPAKQGFKAFFADFRAAVLAGDRAKVAGMVNLPFKDFAGGTVDRSAKTRAQFLAHYDQLFTPKAIAAIRASKIRAFVPGSDDGEAPGPLMKGEYLLNAPDWADQLVFSPKGGTYLLTRVPFYS